MYFFKKFQKPDTSLHFVLEFWIRVKDNTLIQVYRPCHVTDLTNILGSANGKIASALLLPCWQNSIHGLHFNHVNAL